jgi:flagellar assembly protein FliH
VHHAKKVAVFKNSQDEGRRIVEDARKEAEKEAESIKKNAFIKGYQEGMSKAVSEGKADISNAVNSFFCLTSKLTAYKKTLEEEAEGQLLKLAVEIANKIILTQLKEDDEIILRIVKKALKNLIDRESLTIKLHPDDIEVIKREKVKLMQEIDGIKKIIIIEDENVLRGGCYIETEYSEVDARIDKQLETIKETLERK